MRGWIQKDGKGIGKVDLVKTQAAIGVEYRRLTKRVLGAQKWNYLLRHSRATELYKLAKENKISKDTAIKFMGHSEDMSSTYTHLDKEDVKQMLKEQIYHLEKLPPEKKHALELEIEILKSNAKKQNEETTNLKKQLENTFLGIKNDMERIGLSMKLEEQRRKKK